MVTDLEQHIQQTPLTSTHEHLCTQPSFPLETPTLLQEIFGAATGAMAMAGADHAAFAAFRDPNADIRRAFEGIREAWQRVRHTGEGELCRLTARVAYGIDEITPEALEAARERHSELYRPENYLRLLGERGNFDHIQIDNRHLPTVADREGIDFFLYDLSWERPSYGWIDAEKIQQWVGIEIMDVHSLRAAIEAIFAKYGPVSIAVKSQHAYYRTLCWEERSDSDVAALIPKAVGGTEMTHQERVCLGDWCLARAVEQCALYNLPFKLHTGYTVGTGYINFENIKASNLRAIAARYPEVRFSCMHLSYPECEELVAFAKHYPNIHVDMCWGWTVNPHAAANLLRSMIHAVPSNRLFVFGGDTFWPNNCLAAATQARRWLTIALQSEIDDGHMTEAEAMDLATRLMRTNQSLCFDVEGTRAALRQTAERDGFTLIPHV